MVIGNKVSFDVRSFRSEMYSIVYGHSYPDIFIDVRSVVFINVQNSMSCM